MRILSTWCAAISILIFTAVPAFADGVTSFSSAGLDHVTNCPGIYIIYDASTPFYVGRSTVGVRERLRRHLNGSGSRKVAELVASRPNNLSVRYLCGDSPEQMEAQTILVLQTMGLGNIASVSDPADRFPQ